MAKFLLLTVIILAVLMVFKVINLKKTLAKQQNNLKTYDKTTGEEMVRCAQCDIFLPRSEAYMSRGQTWCCAEHARQGLEK